MVGEQFGSYELQRILGRGGMAEVYLAKHPKFPMKPFVVKRIHPEYADQHNFVQRFVLEAQVASRITHPNLVTFREFGKVGDYYYLVMDQVRGHSLHRLLSASCAQGLRFPISAALYIGMGLLNGLAAMHTARDEQGHLRPFIHRDVTPTNIIINQAGRPTIIDFGIAKDVLGTPITLPGQVIGTARYMAPEHRQAEYVDARADVFSASVVLYELLTGLHPWPPLKGLKELLRTTFDPPDIPESIRTSVSHTALNLILRGLACKPQDRFADAETMHQALSAILTNTQTEVARSNVCSFVNNLDLPLDEELGGPVINTHSRLGSHKPSAFVNASSLRVDSKTSRNLDPTAALEVPPLPPARNMTATFDEIRTAALGPSPDRWHLIALLLLGLGLFLMLRLAS